MALGFLVALGWIPNTILGWIWNAVELRREVVLQKPRPQKLIHRKHNNNWNRHHGRASARRS
jgi:hypothetical protein